MKQGLILVVQHRKGDIGPHSGGGLRPGAGHRQDGIAHILIGITERLLQAGPLLLGADGRPVVGHLQVGQVDQVAVQPFAVGLAGGVALLELLVPDDAPFFGIHQQHPPRLEPGFLHDALRREIQHPHLGGEDELIVVRHVIPGGPQAVAVQHRAHHVAVGEEDGGRTVPGLHERGVILVQIPLGAGNGAVVAPGLRDRHHDGQRQVHARHHQKLQRIVQHGRVGAGDVDHRQHLVHIPVQQPGGHGLLPGQHTVHIAPDSVDLAVVGHEAVGVGPLPGRVGVGGEAGVDQGHGGLIVAALQIRIEAPQLFHQKHALIDDGTAGQ